MERRGAVFLAERSDPTLRQLLDASRDLGLHSTVVDLSHARDLWNFSHRLCLALGIPDDDTPGRVALDTFVELLLSAIDAIDNTVGRVLVLDNIDGFAAGDPADFKAWMEVLVDLFNVRLGWQSYPTNPRYHFFDPDGPAWHVLMTGSRPILAEAKDAIAARNEQIVKSPYPWVSYYNIPVPVIEVS
jgi:hypothetical protein